MIEGSPGGTGQPSAAASGVDLNVSQSPARPKQHRTVVWIVLATLVVIAAGFGVHFYLSHRIFLVSGEILYKPEVETEDGTVEPATSVMPVQGAEVVVYTSLWLPDLLHFKNRFYPFDPRRGPVFEHLKIEAQQKLVKDWQDQVVNWNQRLQDCSEAMSHTSKPQEVVRTYTDATGQFTLRLKPGVYYLLASSEVPSFVMDDDGKLSPTTGYAFWLEQLDVTGETNLVTAQPACSPNRTGDRAATNSNIDTLSNFSTPPDQ